jgi:hypothetical protein
MNDAWYGITEQKDLGERPHCWELEDNPEHDTNGFKKFGKMIRYNV